MVIIENEKAIRYAEDNNGNSMKQYFPAIWLRNLSKGYLGNYAYEQPILIWSNQSISWYTEERLGLTSWNTEKVKYIYCGIG